MAVLHGLKHIAEMPAAFRLNFNAPGFLILRADFIVLNMLEAREAVGNCAHIAAALDVILPAKWIYAAAVAAHVSGEDGQIDERYHVVHRVVMLGNAQGPAKLRARSL